MSLASIRQTLRSHADPARAKKSQTFFKTAPGQYGAGDHFIGITTPHLRKIARTYATLPEKEVSELLYSPIHEERFLALLILILQFQQGDQERRTATYHYYTKNLSQVNNWDLVDLSAHHIAGAYLYDRDRAPLHDWVASSNLWKRRIAIIATLYFIRKNDFTTTLDLAKKLLKDPHDLMHKATGWMLREVGKKDQAVLLDFLDNHILPRTALRYAIERLTPDLQHSLYEPPPKIASPIAPKAPLQDKITTHPPHI